MLFRIRLTFRAKHQGGNHMMIHTRYTRQLGQAHVCIHASATECWAMQCHSGAPRTASLSYRLHSREYWMIYYLWRTRLSRRQMIWLLRFYPMPSPPLPSASCLAFSVFLCVAGQAYWRKKGGRGWGRRRQIIRRRQSLVLCKLFNTLCLIQMAVDLAGYRRVQ